MSYKIVITSLISTNKLKTDYLCDKTLAYAFFYHHISMYGKDIFSEKDECHFEVPVFKSPNIYNQDYLRHK